MSADNGYVIRVNNQGQYVVQMYFASADEYPAIESKSARRYNNLEDAVLAAGEFEAQWPSEYGLTIDSSVIESRKKRTKMIETHKYARKPFHVDAAQVTAENMGDIAEWCQGTVQTTKPPSTGEELAFQPEQFIKVRVHRPLNDRQTKAFVGDWVLQTSTGFKVYPDKTFQNSFAQVGEDTIMHGPPATAEPQVAVVEVTVPVAVAPNLVANPSPAPTGMTPGVATPAVMARDADLS